MRIKLFALLLAVTSLIGCGTLPETRVNTNKYRIQAPLEIDSQENVQIDVYEGQFPEGVIKEGDIISVESEYRNTIQILGTVSVELKRGSYNTPFFFGPGHAIFVKEDEITGIHKYCKAISFQKFLYGPLSAPLNYIFPWNYPCYAIHDEGGDKVSNIEYRKDALLEKAKQAALGLGGNAIIGYNVGGINWINTQTGASIANEDAWSAGGYVVILKPQP